MGSNSKVDDWMWLALAAIILIAVAKFVYPII